MPDNGKPIKISAQLDVQSFQQVTNAVKALTNELVKLSQAGGALFGGGGGGFGGVSVGGTAPSRQQAIQKSAANGQQGGGQQQTMGKVLLDNAQAFKKFAAEGSNASKIMTDALKRDIGQQERDLDRLQNKLKGLSDEFAMATVKQKEFLAAGKTGDANAMGKYIQDVEGKLAGASGQLVRGNRDLGTMREMAGQAPGGGGGWNNFLNGIGYSGSGFGGSPMGILKGIGSLATGLGVAVSAGINEQNAGYRSFGYHEALRGGLIEGDVRRLRGGDVTMMQAMRQIMSDPDKRMDFAATTGGVKSGANKGIAALLHGVIGGAASATGLGLLGGLVPKDVSGLISDAMTTPGKNAALKAAFGQLASNTPVIGGLLSTLGIGGGPGDGTMFGGFTTAGQNEFMMQKQREAIRNQESSPEFMRRKFALEGFQASFGSRISTGRIMGLGTGIDKNGRGFDSYGDYDVAMTHLGLTPDAGAQSYAAMRAIGGREFARNMGTKNALANAAGWGGYGEMAAKALRGGGNADLALGGGVEGAVGIGLGNMMFGYNPLGTTSGEGLLGAAQGGFAGMGAGQQFNRLEALGGAINLGNAMANGSLDPFTKGTNVLSASNILSGGGKNKVSSYAIDYLANGMDLKQMADIGFGNGKMTADMQVMGIGRKDVRSQFDAMSRNFFKPLVGDTGLMGEAVRKFEESGMSYRDFIKANPQYSQALDVAINQRSKSGGESAGALGSIFRDMGKSAKAGKLGIGALGKLESGQLDVQAETKRDDAAELAGGVKDIAADQKNARGLRNKMVDNASNLSSDVANVRTALMDFAAAVSVATGRIKAGPK